MKWIVEAESIDDIVLGNYSIRDTPLVECKDCIDQTESWCGIKYCEAHGDHIGKDYDYCSNARRRTDD